MKQATLFLLLLISLSTIAQTYSVSGRVYDSETGKPAKNVSVTLEKLTNKTATDSTGYYVLENIAPGTHKIIFRNMFYDRNAVAFTITNKNEVLEDIKVTPSVKQLSEVVVKEENTGFGVTRLKSVSEAAIYEGKKNEVLVMDQMNINLAANVSRQIFAKVPGINIYESDAAGLQLGVATRGLDPNRTSNFNTRQNGYDMAADALGYPESYYVPPGDAVERIEVVRGAASLQYGPQFGGMLNYVLHKAPTDKKIEWTSQTSFGAYKMISTYNSLGGTIKRFNYYGYYNYKQGSSWRKYGDYKLHTAFASLGYQITEKLSINGQYTYSHYLAQQPGGLTDAQFENDPKQALRTRNWFSSTWNILALNLNYKHNAYHLFNFRTWGFLGSRDAVGYLGPANRFDDTTSARDLIKDKYKNFGAEARYVWKYYLGKSISSLLVGARIYKGETNKTQGFGSNGKDANFEFTNDSLVSSDFIFPGTNFAFFTENVFNIKNKVKIVPGLRYEHIFTKSKGYYRTVVNNEVLPATTNEQRQFGRNFVLLGLGVSYNVWKNTELYANFSQNYRGITFTDMRVIRTSQIVDPNLRDENGFNMDLGYRGSPFTWLMYDVSGFWLQYNNRIGQIQIVDSLYNIYRYTTNVGSSRGLGFEGYVEVDILDAAGVSKKAGNLSVFVSGGYTNAVYIKSNYVNVVGKFLEFAPQFTLRSGITYRYKKFSTTIQGSYTGQQFTDATNATFTSSAVNGLIPAYYVLDWSAKYSIKCVQLSAGINNLTNNKYFTRRAVSYPGPGIIPSEPLTFFVTLGIKLNERVVKEKWNTF